jgi:hypothetical protein
VIHTSELIVLSDRSCPTAGCGSREHEPGQDVRDPTHLGKAPDPARAARLTRAQVSAALKRARRHGIPEKATAVMAAPQDPQAAPALQLVVEVPSMPSELPQMFLVREPEHLRGLMMSFGHVLVFLPAWRFPRQVGDIEQGVIALRKGAISQLLMAEIVWPREAQYLLDPRTS